MKTRPTANQSKSKRWMSLGAGLGLALALLVFCYFAFVMANEPKPPTEAVAAEESAPVYGLLDVTSTPAAAMEQPTIEREVVAPVATAVESEVSAVVSAPVATPEPVLPVNILSQDTDNLPFVPDVVLEQARNQVQTTAEGVPYVEQTAHRAEFADGGLAFTALPETAGTSAQDDEETTPDLAGSPAIAVQLASITIGTTTLADKQTAPTAEIESNVVRYDRGHGVVEEFIARDAGVEQRWWLEEKPSQSGDLTLVIEVETALTLETTGEGFVFQAFDQIPGQMVPVISYARPQAVDANQQTYWGQTDGRLITTNDAGVNQYQLTFSFPADWLAQVQYPLLIDPLVSGLLRLEQGSPAQNQENVQIAYNPDDNEFLLVWQDKRNGNNYDIYGQRLDGDGALLDDNFTINTASYNQDVPQVAYAPGSGKYLVTWRHYTSALQNDLYGQFLTGNGQPSGSAFVITTGPASTLQKPTDIIYNSQSSQFLVLWEDSRTTYTNIWGKHVSLSGSLGSEIQITTATTSNQSLAAGAYNGDNQQYLVVWATADYKIYGRRLTAGGVVTTTDSILLANNFGLTAPDVVYVPGAGQYLATWQDNRNSSTNSTDIYAQRVAPDGTLTSSNIIVSAHTASETTPRLALSADGGTWVVWQRNNGATTGKDLYAQELNGNGQLVGSMVTVYQDNTPGADPTDQDRPVIALNALGDIVFAWQDYRHGNYDVYARLRLDNGNIGGDFLTHPATGNQENVRIAFNTALNEYLVVWQDFRNDLLGWQVYGQRVSSSGSLIGDNIVINSAGIEPDVAYSSASNDYLVVWNYNNTIMGQRVTANGGLSGSAYLVIPGLSKGTLADQPSVVYNPTTNLFLVALRVREPGPNTVHKIIARQTPGTYINELLVNQTNVAVAEPDIAVASDGGYLVVWQDARNSTFDIYGRRLTSAGVANGNDFFVSNLFGDDTSPDVAWNSTASAFLVVWENYAVGVSNITSYIAGQRVNTSGALLGSTLILDSTDSNGEDVGYVTNPSVTSSDGKWLVVWQDARDGSTLADIKARTIRADGVLLAGQTIPLMVTAGEQKNPVIVGGNLDYALLAWQDNREGSWDLYAALYQMDVAVAGLTAMNNSPTALGNSTQLTATITAGTNVVYTWNFGDNTTGSGATPSHTYTQPGIYTAIVTATNSDNLLTASTVVTIYQAAVADFVGIPVSGTVPLSVTFTNSSTFATSFLWQFGDGATSTAISPTHIYTQTGIYTVTLWASNPYSSDVLTRSAYITVYDNNPSAIIVKEGPAIVEAGEPITYTLTVTNNGFYNLTNLVITDTLPSGVTYVSGGTLIGQTVRWTFSSLAAGDSLSVSFVITANSLVINDRYAVTASGGLYATGEPVITVIGEPWGGYWWDDTFFYRRPLTLTTGNVITSGPGITNTVAFTIATSTLISEGKLQIDGDDLRVLYRDVLGWHLLPAQISSVVSPTAVITFPLASALPDVEGTYWLYYGNAIAGPGPELEAPDVTAAQVITHVTGTGTITPTVTFFADPRLAWVGQSISFTHYVTPVAAIETFTWNFGDGITSTISNTNHAYMAPGVYTVTLTVTTTEGLAVTYGYTNYITILADQSNVVTVTVGNEEEPVVITTLTAGQSGEAQSAMGDFFVSFPAGAITQTLIITHTPFQAEVQQNAGVMKRFALDAAATTGQAVTQFGQPLQLVLDLTAWNMTAEEMATVVFFYWDETEAEWVALPTTVDTAHGVALATTDHFSDFAAASNYGLGGAPALRRLPSVREGGVDLLTGSSTYVYPLEVPPGTHGVQPNLSLVYNSGAADTLLDQQAGIVGHGFELAGLGWIQVDPNDSDTYYLNLNGVSEKLIHETGTNIYHTEHETFWRIIKIASGSHHGVIGLEDSYWLVVTQDGMQYQFGREPGAVSYGLDRRDNPVAYRYNLDQVQDVYGNTIVISWGESYGSIGGVYYVRAAWPKVLTYTQNSEADLIATRRIDFVYTSTQTTNNFGIRADYPNGRDCNDAGPGLTYGYFDALDRIEISVDVNGTGNFVPVRTYGFGYEYFTQDGGLPSHFGPCSYHLMLRRITEHGADGTPLPTTLLTYTLTGHLRYVDNGYNGGLEYQYEPVSYWAEDLAVFTDPHFDNSLPGAAVGTIRPGDSPNQQDEQRWRVIAKKTLNSGLISQNLSYEYRPAIYDGKFVGHQVITVSISGENSETVTRFYMGLYDTFVEEFPHGWDDLITVRPPFAYEEFWGQPHEIRIQQNGQKLLQTTNLFLRTVTYSGLDGNAATTLLGCTTLRSGNDSPPITTCYDYDTYGRVIMVDERGANQGLAYADDRKTYINYLAPNGIYAPTNLPLTTTVKTYTDTVIARTLYDYVFYPSTQAIQYLETTQEEVSFYNGPDLVRHFSYDQVGNVSEFWVGNLQRTTSVVYDPVHRTFPQFISYPEGLEESFMYDARFGTTTYITDVNGLVTKYVFDTFGQVITQTVDGLGPIQYGYSHNIPELGLQVAITYTGEAGLSDDVTIIQQYNSIGQLAQAKQPYNNISGNEPFAATTDYMYDALGRLVATTVPYRTLVPEQTLHTTYDALGRPLTIETLDGTTQYAYPNWQTTIITDAKGFRKVYEVDVLGHLVSVAEYDDWGDPQSAVYTTTYQYRVGNEFIVTIRDAQHNVTLIYFDSLGRKRAMLDPDMGYWTYSYSQFGELEAQTDARGVITTWEYDNLGRVLTKTYDIPSGSGVAATSLVTYDYQDSFLSEMQDGSGQTMWQHDSAGRVLTETKVISGQIFSTLYSYDAFGRLASMTYPDGEVVTYTYNLAGQALYVVGQDNYLANATYDVLGQPTSWTLGNGVEQELIYKDSDSFRPYIITATNGSNAVIQRLTLLYDGLGRLFHWANNIPGNSLTLYSSYDSLSRLTHVDASIDTFDQDYDYDAIGNLITRTGYINQLFDQNSFNRPHLPESDANGTTYTYDANGNLMRREMQSGQVISYTYDAENRLTQVISRTGTVSALTLFSYSGDGQRVMQILPDGEEIRFVGDYYVYRGATGTTPVGQVIGTEGIDSCLALDSSGAPYFLWSGSINNEMWFRSLNSTEISLGLGERPAIVIDENDTIHGIWYRPNGNGSQIIYRYSSNGTNWSNEEIVYSASPYYAYSPALAITPDGSVHALWTTATGIRHAFRNPNTGVWSSPVLVGGGDGISIAADSLGNVYAAWVSNWSGNNNVYLKRWDGSIWTDLHIVANDPTRIFALVTALAIDDQDTLHVSWAYHNNQASPERFLFYQSKSVAGVWSSVEIVTTDIKAIDAAWFTFDLEVTTSGTVYMVWMRPINPVIVYAHRTLTGDWVYTNTDFSGSLITLNCMLGYNEFTGVHLTWTGYNDDVMYAQLDRPSSVSKRYFAGGQQVATRVDGELFYHLNDPSGTSLTMVDETGTQHWQVVYDGYGMVLTTLTNTLPITHTWMQTLLGLPDAASNLVYQGNGRYYDPALGRPLQPNPAGAPPTVPQALNRYAAAPMGQPGVFQSQSSSGFSPFLMATGLNAISAGGGMGVSAYANHLVGDLLIQTTNKTLRSAGMGAVFSPISDIRGYYHSGLVTHLDETTFQLFESGEVISLTDLERYGKVSYLGKEAKSAFIAFNDNLLKQILRTKSGEFATGVVINLALSYYDFAATWQDPYFSTGQKTVQTLVTIGGAAASTGASMAVGGWAAATGLGGPVTFVVLTGTGIIVYATWEYAVKPAASWIAVNVAGATDPYQHIRNLQPLRN